MSEIYYLIRSRADGSYLVAHPHQDQTSQLSYLLLFREHFDALSYLNKYATDLADRFTVESIPSSQLRGILSRWGFTGIGIVQDPLLPRIEFVVQN